MAVFENATNDRWVVYPVYNVDGTAAAATLIFTPGSTFTPTNVVVTLTSVSGFVSVSSLSVGTNATSYNNILPISALTGLIGANISLNIPIVSAISSVSGGTGVFVNITTPAVATSFVLEVSVLGFYN